jgi:hypothetical protein
VIAETFGMKVINPKTPMRRESSGTAIKNLRFVIIELVYSSSVGLFLAYGQFHHHLMKRGSLEQGEPDSTWRQSDTYFISSCSETKLSGFVAIVASGAVTRVASVGLPDRIS